ncbi:MAG: hypothetical protein WBV82_06420 [Myxococcaceae bacterium]
MTGTTAKNAVVSKVMGLLRENEWVRRTSNKVADALLTFVDSAEQVGPRRAVTNTVKDTVKKTARNTVRKVTPGKRKAAGKSEAGAVRARAAPAARERRIPKEIRTTGGHGLSREVVERAVKHSASTPDFKVKKGKRG